MRDGTVQRNLVFFLLLVHDAENAIALGNKKDILWTALIFCN